MNITTKYNIWDTVWTIKYNKAYSFEIYKIEIRRWIVTNNIIAYHEAGTATTATEAHIFRESDKYRYDEDDLVWSREELITLL